MPNTPYNISTSNCKAGNVANPEAVNFLLQLRTPPWILIAITPDSHITAITAHDVENADAFISSHVGKANLYYSVNPTKEAMNKKPAKADIIAIEYLLGDLDPADSEKSEDAKARYLEQLNGAFEPKATALVDSGNGIQGLWKLVPRIELGDTKERDAIIADAEGRSAALMRRLGAKAGTQNIDRILRLPGTINLPNAKKLKVGRVPCPTKLLAFNGGGYSLELFVPGSPEDGGHHARQQEHDEERSAIDVDGLPVSDRIKNLIRGINDPEHPYESRSEAVFAVVMAMVSAKCPDKRIQDLMFDKSFPIGAHVREQPNPTDYLVRQIRHALAKIGGPDAVVREIQIKARMDDILKSAAELRMKTFEPLRWIVPKYLPEGLTMLGGRPKIGKSWQALDAAVAVSSGGMCLGEQCEQGDVLALMLEDSDRRLQRRFTLMLGALIGEWPSRLTYATSWPRLNEGGIDWIREWIRRSPKARLIVIDILERVRQLTNDKDKRTQ